MDCGRPSTGSSVDETATPGPLRAAAYLLVLGGPNHRLLDEFLFSFASLRRHHPGLPVFVYHEGLPDTARALLDALPEVVPTPIAARQPRRFERNDYDTRYGWTFPELEILAAKIDVLLLTPGDTLFLDTDTEVRAPLDDVLASDRVWMHDDEGPLGSQDGRDFSSVLGPSAARAFGWRDDLGGLRMLNSGAMWVPQNVKPSLYAAKEYLWAMSAVPGSARGDNRLDEQVALSVALQQAGAGPVRTMAHLVDHYWREKYEQPSPRTPQYVAVSDDGEIGVPADLLARLGFEHPEAADAIALP